MQINDRVSWVKVGRTSARVCNGVVVAVSDDGNMVSVRTLKGKKVYEIPATAVKTAEEVNKAMRGIVDKFRNTSASFTVKGNP